VNLLIAVVLAFASVSGSPRSLPAREIQAAPQGPDVSGLWTRHTISGTGGSGSNAGWGPSVGIDQAGSDLTVQPQQGGRTERYKLDGTETSETLTTGPCARQIRITRTVATPRTITITAWLVNLPGCPHGQSDLFRPGEEEVDVPKDPPSIVRASGAPAAGQRSLESITVISRQGGTLTVETTRASANGAPTVTTTTYQK